ncbi:hypothetical protein [Helicobacter cinaedi]|uniref:hypothetical protein n=1 Tax=Helicobacter cinaedi TaxID=213 RepID=UPI000CF06A20|nr:hypothetical protein [Helicobacter cinaedi]QOQ95479.1 hypothetical protein HW245_07440 [Helicobacter cinaedi]
MQYFVTIYIDTMKPKLDFIPFTIPHAFLGLTHTHPDELDSQSNIEIEKYSNPRYDSLIGYYFNTIKKDKGKWYERVYPSILSDEFEGEGFFGFGPVTHDTNHWGKVYENNQYAPESNNVVNEYVEPYYYKERSLSTFWQQNRCVFEISKEQYEALVESIKVDVKNTLYINKNSQAAITKELKYDFTNNNCTTWALNKLDSIGIEIIDNEEWLPDNISTRDSLLQKFHYLQYLYAVFRKFQSIDSNLESIAGAKAFRTWARSMTQNKIFCALKIEGDITKGLNISTECKRTITQNQKYYENKLKDFITKSSDFMRVYNRINEQLERLLTKVKNLGYTNIQGDFTFIMWNDELQTRMLLDSKHRDENTKDYIAYPIEQIDPNIPACNWTLNHNASFILILRDEMLCRAVYKNYHYSNMSESFIDSINKSHIAILSGNDDLSYWSKSLHALRKSVVCEE